DETRTLYVDSQVDKEVADAEAIKRALLLALKSPRCLYPPLEQGESSSRAVGNRIALIPFDPPPPDDWLTNSISKGEKQTPDQVRDYVQNSIDDYRVRAKTRRMLYEWLNIGQFNDISKNQELFAGFDQALIADLRSSLDAFLDDIVWSE